MWFHIMRKGFIVSGCILMGIIGLINGQHYQAQAATMIDTLVDDISAANIEAGQEANW